MAHFDNPDPFSHEDADPRKNGESKNGKPERGISTTNPTPSLPDDTLNNIPSQTRTQSDNSDSDEHQPGHQRTIDKLTSAVDNVQSGVKEKAKSAAQHLHLKSIHATSVSRVLNPTVLRMKIIRYDSVSDSDGAIHNSKEQELLWRARDNRKGRNSIAVSRFPEDDDDMVLPMRFTPRMKGSAQEIGQTLWRMATVFA